MLLPVLRSLILLLTLGVSLLAGCAPVQTTTGAATVVGTAQTRALIPRPEGSPDVLVLAVSGRCPSPCHAPDDNIDYLTPRGTLGAVVRALEAQGLSVQSMGVAAHVGAHRPALIVQAQVGAGHTVPAEQAGFVQLEDRLVAANRDWIVGRSNPTRIVLLAHSHGVVWSHALARAHPEVPISTMIDLDGVCDLWEMDNRRLVRAYIQEQGRSPWAFDLADSCGSVRVGHVLYDLKDVVFPNVAVNLEVQSQRLLSRADGSLVANLPFDALSNVRPDGSRTGLTMYRSVGETHSSVSSPGSRAMTWALAQLSALSVGWKSGAVAARTGH